MEDKAALADIDRKIQIVEDNLRELIEQAAAFSGAADEERAAQALPPAYHGAEGFKTMSHAKAVLRQARFNAVDLFRPPFGKAFDFLLNMQLR